MTPETTTREALTLFDFDDAVPLGEAGMMSMPTMTEPAPEQMADWVTAGGQDVRVLFRQAGDDGCSLVWAWFGPHYILPRHSHSADCLYYVVKGEAHLGNRVVKAGSGFFVPADAPYAYQAGPEGIEILEFRGATSFDMKISESLPRWERILEGAREHSETWAAAADAHR
jgi:quercetin dioxygenase-like cupin family protein